MAHVITDATFEQETSQGLVLIDFGQLGAVHAACKLNLGSVGRRST